VIDPCGHDETGIGVVQQFDPQGLQGKSTTRRVVTSQNPRAGSPGGAAGGGSCWCASSGALSKRTTLGKRVEAGSPERAPSKRTAVGSLVHAAAVVQGSGVTVMGEKATQTGRHTGADLADVSASSRPSAHSDRRVVQPAGRTRVKATGRADGPGSWGPAR